jgi:hypothetical protein
MIISIALLVISYLLPVSLRDSLEVVRPVFVLESVAIIAFGFAWFVKGQGLFMDEVPDATL